MCLRLPSLIMNDTPSLCPDPLGLTAARQSLTTNRTIVEYSMRKGFEDPFCKAYSTQGAAAGQRPALGAWPTYQQGWRPTQLLVHVRRLAYTHCRRVNGPGFDGCIDGTEGSLPPSNPGPFKLRIVYLFAALIGRQAVLRMSRAVVVSFLSSVDATLDVFDSGATSPAMRRSRKASRGSQLFELMLPRCTDFSFQHQEGPQILTGGPNSFVRSDTCRFHRLVPRHR